MNITVIAGPAKTGKLPLARAIMERNNSYVLVHRDFIREALVTEIPEGDLTLLTVAIARSLFQSGHSVLVVGWNMMEADNHRWIELCAEVECKLVWLDTREPDVAAMIPAMDDERRWKLWGMEQEVP